MPGLRLKCALGLGIAGALLLCTAPAWGYPNCDPLFEQACGDGCCSILLRCCQRQTHCPHGPTYYEWACCMWIQDCASCLGTPPPCPQVPPIEPIDG